MAIARVHVHFAAICDETCVRHPQPWFFTISWTPGQLVWHTVRFILRSLEGQPIMIRSRSLLLAGSMGSNSSWRSFSATQSLEGKNIRTGVPKGTNNRSRPLTYEQAKKPSDIGVTKYWNSINTSEWGTRAIVVFGFSPSSSHYLNISAQVHCTWTRPIISGCLGPQKQPLRTSLSGN